MPNPNFQEDMRGAMDNQEPDPQDPNESSGNEMSFSTQDYPELDGLNPGDPVEMKCQAKVSNSDNGMVTLAIEPGACEFQTQGPADKAMKDMSKQDSQTSQNPSANGEDF